MTQLCNSVLPPIKPDLSIALVGNPNCGKTTLFNALTGTWQKVGNWAGVTVEHKSGHFALDDQTFEIVDLPGTYSLTTLSHEGPQDETITSDYLKTRAFSLVLNVIDAVNLERNLYLTLQLLEQKLPVIIALNRIDLAKKSHQSIDVQQLSTLLGCAIVPLVARQGEGISALKDKLKDIPNASGLNIIYPPVIENQLQNLSEVYTQLMGSPVAANTLRFQLLRWLEGEQVPCGLPLTKNITQAQQDILTQSGQAADVVIAAARYELIDNIIAQVKKTTLKAPKPTQDFSAQLDKIICHRWLGIPCFLLVMYGLFFFAINIGGVFQDFFELSSHAVFVDGLGKMLTALSAPTWLKAIFLSGIGMGISTILTFVPVIGAMFLALAFLEDCGYMSRAAFVMDRFMRALGLPGKSFVPLIVGFGCNVPAIMGTRTLDNKRDRILAVMMSPFMSCGARLAIFTVFVAAFFPVGGQNIVFLLYLIGIVMAILTGLLLKKTLLKGEVVPLLLEMPPFQWPHWQSLKMHCWHRLRKFILNAGRLILPVCIVIGLLNSMSLQGEWLEKEADKRSILSVIGQGLVPLFKPMGMEKENWPAAVGLFTGILAKEVVIGTLNSLYGAPELEKALAPVSVGQQLSAAVMTIPQNFWALNDAWQNPIAAKAPEAQMHEHAYGEMVKRFNGQASAFAYLLFVLLYFPCISATAAMVREVQRGWTIFSVCWTTGLAYVMAVVYYQSATFTLHPLQSSVWVGIWVCIGTAVFLGIRYYSRRYIPRILPTPIIVNLR